MCGVYLHRGRIILTVTFVAIAIWPLIFGETIFVAIGIDKEVSRLTQLQMRVQMPGVFFYGHFDLLKRWLASMRITFFPMVATIVAAVFYILLCFLFVVYFDMGIIGLAVAMSIKDCALLFMTLIYCYCSEPVRKVLVPLDSEAFWGWSEYLKISIPATFMICSARWAGHVISFMAGMLGVVELASITVVFSFRVGLFTFAQGIEEGTCALIGNCIGANNVPLAKRFYSLIGMLAMGLIVPLSLITFFAREQLAALFTNEEDV